VKYGREGSERTAERGGGGLVTALSGLAGHLDDAVWICAAMTDEDRIVAAEHDGRSFTVDDGSGVRVRMVEVDAGAHDRFYAVIANPLLWFVQHYLWDLSDAPDITPREVDAFDNGYVPVNARFSDVVAEEVDARGRRALVMTQDYHFYLVGERVRARCPDVYLHHFVHIPWPQPDAWRVLPPSMRDTCSAGCSATTWSRSTPSATPATSCSAAGSSSGCAPTWMR